MEKIKTIIALLLSLAVVLSVPSLGLSKSGGAGNGTGVVKLMEFTEQPSIRLDK